MRARILPIACLLLGAALLSGGVLGHRWATTQPGGAVGLLDTVGCSPRRYYGTAGCGVHGSTEATRIEGEQFARLGQLAFIVGALAALGALAASHPRLRRPLAVPVVALALGALAAGSAFAITEPFAQFGADWRPGPAWWLLASGAVLVVAGVRLGPPEVPGRRSAWILLAVAAPLLATTARTTWWWRGPEVSYDMNSAQLAIGPAMVERCDRGGCAQARLGDVTTAHADAPSGLDAPQADLMAAITDEVVPRARLRASALIAGRSIAVFAALAAVLAAALALLAAARRRARGLAWATLAATAALLVSILIFEASGPSSAISRIGDLHRSIGLPLALLAAALAVVPSIRLARTSSTVTVTSTPMVASSSASTAASPSAVSPIPPCPVCATPMLFVSRRRAWLCTVCKSPRDSVAT